ncbi:MAG: hypothetical protein SOW12_08160, partial [Lachnospiraceae bacterium]|nr:hypothetical protein [Lachnospiraceae bacterium]
IAKDVECVRRYAHLKQRKKNSRGKKPGQDNLQQTAFIKIPTNLFVSFLYGYDIAPDSIKS